MLLLVHVAGLELTSAITPSLVVVAGMSLVGVVPHARAGNVVWQAAVGFGWRIAAALGVAEAAGSLLGVHLGRRVSAKALRRAFAGVMLLAAVGQLGSSVLR